MYAWKEVEEERQVGGGSVSAWYEGCVHGRRWRRKDRWVGGVSVRGMGGVCMGGGGGGKTGGWGECQCVVWGVCVWGGGGGKTGGGRSVSVWYGGCVYRERGCDICNVYTHAHTRNSLTLLIQHTGTHTHTSTCTISSHTTHTYLNRDIQFSSTNGEVCSE